VRSQQLGADGDDLGVHGKSVNEVGGRQQSAIGLCGRMSCVADSSGLQFRIWW
jgi:hypothetical protein